MDEDSNWVPQDPPPRLGTLVDWMFTLTAAYKLIRLPKLLAA
jgi:hypothetical protein